MRTLLLIALVGLVAQLVDGSLGMAYGVTSATLLLALGTAPAAVSATVHLAEIGTTLASGIAHWRFGNVEWSVVLRVGLPGAVGAFAGATILSHLSTSAAAPIMSFVLLGLGLYILTRFTVRGIPTDRRTMPLRKRFLMPLGLVAGFLDATGGGGWGPVGTPALLASGRLEPRKVIGSIDTAEFLVALAASGGFLLALSNQGVQLLWVLGLFLGGIVAAPIAAWLVRHIPPRIMGSVVGGMIVLTNSRTLLSSDAVGWQGLTLWSTLAVLALIWAAAVIWSVRAYRADNAAAAADTEGARTAAASVTAGVMAEDAQVHNTHLEDSNDNESARHDDGHPDSQRRGSSSPESE